MSSSNIKDYFRIRLSTIRPEKITPFDIFIFVDERMLTYLRAGDQLSARKIHLLHEKDSGQSFFVKIEDKQVYRDWVREELNSETLPSLDKAKILRESSIALMEDLFENPDVNQAIHDSRHVVSDLMEFMEKDPSSMQYLISLSGHDFYTYNHSFDVSIYALGLGHAMSLSGKDLEELGVAALFHDVGKRNVSIDILCKKGPLDEAEWEQMKRHPQYGLIILNQSPEISDAIKAACFEHHESWAGNGYPQKLVGEEIHPYARIVAITDTFDAMTTQRSYNKPMLPSEALTLMRDKIAGRYDPEMLKAMHSVLFRLKAA